MGFSRDLLQGLFRHMEWADARVWAAVPDTAPADERLGRWLTHLHTVQRGFLAVWTGVDLATALGAGAEPASLPDVRRWAQTYYPEAHAFLDGVPERQLNERLELPWAAQLADRFGGSLGATTLGETCFQVTSHSTYHRGQVNARLREIGAEPPLVDYIAWLWFGRPAPEWPA